MSERADAEHRPAGRPHRRDRRGHGLRGPLAPAGVPIARTRAEVFDDLVLDAVEQLENRWASQLERVQFAVEDVPPLIALGRDPIEPVPLGAAFAANSSTPPQIVVYRRPIEARAGDREELADLVHDIVVEEVAQLLGLEPQAVDPTYGGPDDDDPDRP